MIKGYTEKQWGRSATELPAFIIKRLPFRFTYDNNYFNDEYQGIPKGGYNELIHKLLEKAEVRLNTNYFSAREELDALADKVLFTGCIDEFYDYRFGRLEYRSLCFEHERLEIDNYQGNAVVNYCEREIPYTRIIEHLSLIHIWQEILRSVPQSEIQDYCPGQGIVRLVQKRLPSCSFGSTQSIWI